MVNLEELYMTMIIFEIINKCNKQKCFSFFPKFIQKLESTIMSTCKRLGPSTLVYACYNYFKKDNN